MVARAEAEKCHLEESEIEHVWQELQVEIAKLCRDTLGGLVDAIQDVLQQERHGLGLWAGGCTLDLISLALVMGMGDKKGPCLEQQFVFNRSD
ncbi:UNVERIFIED_CONTAM: hypothetical protein K2H54_048404 [Gekko kuhli]